MKTAMRYTAKQPMKALSLSVSPASGLTATALCVLTMVVSGCANSGAATSALPPVPMTPGAVVTNEWWYADGGELTRMDGQWLHLPADEAGELLLWIEWVENNRRPPRYFWGPIPCCSARVFSWATNGGKTIKPSTGNLPRASIACPKCMRRRQPCTGHTSVWMNWMPSRRIMPSAWPGWRRCRKSNGIAPARGRA